MYRLKLIISVDAKLVDAKLVDAKRVDAKFIDAKLVDENLVGAKLVDAKLVDAKLVDAKRVDAKFIDAKLVDENLVSSKLVDAKRVAVQTYSQRFTQLGENIYSLQHLLQSTDAMKSLGAADCMNTIVEVGKRALRADHVVVCTSVFLL